MDIKNWLKNHKEEIIIGTIFVVAVIIMLAWAIHSVDVYNGTFP